jgi:phenylacetate-CoA ligase
MEKVTGRSDDMVILRGVNLFPTQIEEIVLRTPAVAPHFQLRLTREGRLDALTVRAEARPGATAEERAAAAGAIAAAVKDGIGVSVAVEVVDPESLERSVGKIRRIVDLRGGR